MRERELYHGLIRLHILHHAAKSPVFGLWIIEELNHHGYRLSPGTIYPILHAMERRGYLTSRQQLHDGRIRRVYDATGLGREMLEQAKEKVRELFGELFEDDGQKEILAVVDFGKAPQGGGSDESKKVSGAGGSGCGRPQRTRLGKRRPFRRFQDSSQSPARLTTPSASLPALSNWRLVGFSPRPPTMVSSQVRCFAFAKASGSRSTSRTIPAFRSNCTWILVSWPGSITSENRLAARTQENKFSCDGQRCLIPMHPPRRS